MIEKTPLRLAAGLLVALASLPAAGEGWQIDDLMGLLAKTKAARASFVETRTIGIVDRPVESSGELVFAAPDRLEKLTFKPKPESVVLQGDSLTIEQPGKRPVVISLSDHPEISAFVESVRGTLAGDRTALEASYRLDLSGSADAWQLVLIPTRPAMLKVISRIRIRGLRDDVKAIDFESADGDRFQMAITRIPGP